MPVPQVTKNWNWPAGAISKNAKVIAPLALIAVLIVSIWLSPADKKPGTKYQTAAPAELASTGDRTRAMEQLEHQKKLLEAEFQEAQRKAAQSKTDVDNAMTQIRGDGGYPAQPPPPPDPIAQAKAQIALDVLQREYRSRYAPALAYSAPVSVAAAPQEETEKPAEPPKPAAAEKPEPLKGYVIQESDFVPCILVNRMNSTFTGPVIVQASDNILDRTHRILLIPRGTRFIGEAKAVTAFGQNRIAVSFHRMIRPDGSSLSLDKFVGLNQIGETGLKDKVNNHYLQTFGASLAIGIIGAAATSTSRYSGYDMSGTDYLRQGFGTGMSMAAMQVLNKFLNVPPTVTIREGHRVDVYFSQDLTVSPYTGDGFVAEVNAPK